MAGRIAGWCFRRCVERLIQLPAVCWSNDGYCHVGPTDTPRQTTHAADIDVLVAARAACTKRVMVIGCAARVACNTCCIYLHVVLMVRAGRAARTPSCSCMSPYGC